MRARHLESILGQIYRPCRDVSVAHQAALATRLTAAFTGGPSSRAALPRKRTVPRWLVMTALVFGTALAAAQLPAEYSVRVGELLTISARSGNPAPSLAVLMPMLQQAGSTVARVRIRNVASGVVVVAELWGDTLAPALPEHLHAAFPSCRVSVSSLQGNLRGTVLDKLRYQLLDLADPQRRALARAALLKELARRGENASVDISSGNVAGRPQPRILVRVRGKKTH